ncbi:dehydrogenase [Nitzschia inconspicua]|uniref:Dehydrogenase n=1 Tax=Nitzschia inconspicua TaxID=303405 RepID=A0A9K3LPA0_9STRA|nr:dehydrogenase [Nitzschia inconspicua]KAG7362328.1 dehydrogenase [Nitzschia inconspicua]KAG7365597.1 dehydrogenase [Nitzschia inconspicua]
MRNEGVVLTALLLGAAGCVEGWIPSSRPAAIFSHPTIKSSADQATNEGTAARDETRTSSRSSRRGFFNSITVSSAAAVAATITTPFPSDSAVAAPLPTGLNLVQPNSLTGKMIVITGGTTGLGLESAKALAKGGATVVITARTDAKGKAAVETVLTYLKERGIRNVNVSYVQLDLDDLDNVKSFPQRFMAKYGSDQKIDVLMNNAGVMAIPDRQLTKDGYERTFQSNHLGHFALTAKVMPLLREQGARVINVSSLAYQFAGKGLDLSNLNREKEYSPWGSYGASKLENILFTQELQRRADANGLNLIATSLHPGAVNTDLARNMMGGEEEWYKKKETGPTNLLENVLQSTINKALLTPERGAATQVYLAITSDEEKGRFYSDLKPQKLPAFATDESAAKALWTQSEILSGVQFSLDKKQ